MLLAQNNDQIVLYLKKNVLYVLHTSGSFSLEPNIIFDGIPNFWNCAWLISDSLFNPELVAMHQKYKTLMVLPFSFPKTRLLYRLWPVIYCLPPWSLDEIIYFSDMKNIRDPESVKRRFVKYGGDLKRVLSEDDDQEKFNEALLVLSSSPNSVFKTGVFLCTDLTNNEALHLYSSEQTGYATYWLDFRSNFYRKQFLQLKGFSGISLVFDLLEESKLNISLMNIAENMFKELFLSILLKTSLKSCICEHFFCDIDFDKPTGLISLDEGVRIDFGFKNHAFQVSLIPRKLESSDCFILQTKYLNKIHYVVPSIMRNDLTRMISIENQISKSFLFTNQYCLEAAFLL